jgi:lactoylglutathione lyase
MKLGAFSISLNVRDLQVSKDFYTKLGFEIFGGEMDHNYLIMKNGDSIVGLFQGMFEKKHSDIQSGVGPGLSGIDGLFRCS